MSTSPTVSDRERTEASGSIYEPSRLQATKAVMNGRATAMAAGFSIGAGAWLILARLGVPQVFGVDTLEGALPLALVSASLALTRIRSALVWAVTAFALFFVLVAYTGVVRAPALRLIRADPLPTSADAIVVLSGGMTDDGMLPQQAIDRLLHGLGLVKVGTATTLLVTHESRVIDGRRVSTAGDQVKLARLAGVTDLVSTGLVKSTRQEALAVSRIAKARGWRNLVLVTSPFHSRRACATFERVGLDVSCAPSQSRDIAVRRLRDPQDRVAAFGMLIYETAGTLRYRQLGWL